MNHYFREYQIEPPDFGDHTPCNHPDRGHLFFAPDGERAPDRRVREDEARQLCAGCPFLLDCALHGLTHEDHGFWGGLSERDRRALGGRGVVSPNDRSPVARSTVLGRLRQAGVPRAVVSDLLRYWRWVRHRKVA